jgi:molybdate transport system regulatory protein
MTASKKGGFKLQVIVKPDVKLGPGKADLLDGIKETGSISAASRRMSMSYKTWLRARREH